MLLLKKLNAWFLIPHTIIINIYFNIWLYHSYIKIILPNYKDYGLWDRIGEFYKAIVKDEYRDEIMNHGKILKESIGNMKYVFSFIVWLIVISSILK